MIIYKITNKINGMVYVGQTVRSLEERFKDHKRCKVSYIGKALRKYGVDKIIKIIGAKPINKTEVNN